MVVVVVGVDLTFVALVVAAATTVFTVADDEADRLEVSCDCDCD